MMSSDGYHSRYDEMEENARRRAEIARRKREGVGVIPYGNPKERLMADKKKHLSGSPSSIPSSIGANLPSSSYLGRLKKGVIPKPYQRVSYITAESRRGLFLGLYSSQTRGLA
jgi:hypothetical protein